MKTGMNHSKNGFLACGMWVFCPTKPNKISRKSVFTCLADRLNRADFACFEPFHELFVIYSSGFVPRNDYRNPFLPKEQNSFDRLLLNCEYVENRRIGSRKCLITNESFPIGGTNSDFYGTKTDFLGTFSEVGRDRFGFLRDKKGVGESLWDKNGVNTGQIRSKEKIVLRICPTKG